MIIGNNSLNEALLTKYSTTISAVNKALKESAEFGEGLSSDSKLRLAIMLESTNEGMETWKKLKEAQGVQVGDIARKNDYLNLVAAVMPTLCAEQVVSVQPLQQKAGICFYMKNVYDSARGTIKKGDNIASLQSVWPGDESGDVTGNINFTAETIEDETVTYTVADTNSIAVLDWVPVRPGTVTATNGKAITDVDGELFEAGNATAIGTIDYSTGTITIATAKKPTDDLWSYSQDLTTSPVEAPVIKTIITDVTLTAKPRKLKTVYAFDSAFDLMKAHNLDINALLQETATSEIKAEIDGEILSDLGRSGTTLSVTFNKAVPLGISKTQHFDSFYYTVLEGSNKIYDKSRRVRGNYIIAGADAANIIQNHSTKFKNKTNGSEVGPYIMGEYEGYTVIRNPYYAATKFVIGYRGKNPLDTGYIYAPYMPITSTQFILGANFEGTQGFATSYAKKLVVGDFFCEGTITNVSE